MEPALPAGGPTASRSSAVGETPLRRLGEPAELATIRPGTQHAAEAGDRQHRIQRSASAAQASRAAAAAPAPAASTLRFGDIVLDDVSRTVRVCGAPVELTFKDYALLHLFLEHPEEVLARERIMKDVWDTDDLLESRTIDMHVRSLRQKLGAAGEAIRTVRKVGYKLSTEGSDD